jgi:hypothetical protein
VALWLQASWKFSRALGIANVAVLHGMSDLRAVGASDSEQVGLAEGLLADSETRVVYAQSPGEVERTGELLGLTDTKAALVTQLRRGLALWRVGPTVVSGRAPVGAKRAEPHRYRCRHDRRAPGSAEGISLASVTSTVVGLAGLAAAGLPWPPPPPVTVSSWSPSGTI